MGTLLENIQVMVETLRRQLLYATVIVFTSNCCVIVAHSTGLVMKPGLVHAHVTLPHCMCITPGTAIFFSWMSMGSLAMSELLLSMQLTNQIAELQHNN